MVFSNCTSSTPSKAAIALVLALAVAQSAIAQQSVYVPGNADEVPGVAVNEVGVGADGMTTYDVGGVTLAENSAAAVLTQNLPQGQVIYNCQLGPDAIATCEVQQVYDGASYTYQEPITFFGQTTAQLPAAFQQTTTATPAAAATAVTTSIPIRIVPSAATIPTSLESTTKGPQPSAVQATSSNVFGGAQDTGSASSRAALTTAAGALMAVMAGVVAFL